MENKILQQKHLQIYQTLINYKKYSKAVKRKVSAIITDKDFNILRCGNNYNLLHDKPCELTENITANTVVHAEENAIIEYLKQSTELIGEKIFVSYSPCYNCCRLIVQAGIKEVYIDEVHKSNFFGVRNERFQIIPLQDNTDAKYGGLTPYDFLREYGIKIFFWNEEKQMYIGDFCVNTPKENNKINIGIVYHSADADGWLSAWLMKRYKYNSEYQQEKYNIILIPYNYEKDFSLNNYDRCNTYYFCDCSPSDSVFKELLEYNEINGCKVVINDHHISRYGSICNFRKENPSLELVYNYNNNIAGCQIIFSRFFNKYDLKDKYKPLEFVVDYIGLYDTWAFETREEYKDIQYVVYQLHEYISNFIYSYNDFEAFMKALFDSYIKWESFIDECLQKGEVIIQSKCNKYKKLLEEKTTYVYSKDKTNVMLVIPNFYPDYYIQKYMIPKKVNLDSYVLVTYRVDLDKQEVVFSVRSRNSELTALYICNEFGGGGHTDAAGFSICLGDYYQAIDYIKQMIQFNHIIDKKDEVDNDCSI